MLSRLLIPLAGAMFTEFSFGGDWVGIIARPAGPAMLGCGAGERGAQSWGLGVVAASP